jgi:hypothetical protein
VSDEGPTIDIRMQISPEQADDFLFRAAHDPEFRARVEADPAGVLREYGVEISDETAPHLAQLPGPEDIENLRKQMGAVDEYAEAGAGHPQRIWFVLFTWFANIPKPGGDAAD